MRINPQKVSEARKLAKRSLDLKEYQGEINRNHGVTVKTTP